MSERDHKRARLGAALLAGLWMGAAYAVPALHLVNHRADHVHLPGGAVLFAEDHAHDDSEYDKYFDDDFSWDDEDAPPPKTPEDRPEIPFSHGGASWGHAPIAALCAQAPSLELEPSRFDAPRPALPPWRRKKRSPRQEPQKARAPPRLG